jgi:hypothetical protein
MGECIAPLSISLMEGVNSHTDHIWMSLSCFKVAAKPKKWWQVAWALIGVIALVHPCIYASLATLYPSFPHRSHPCTPSFPPLFRCHGECNLEEVWWWWCGHDNPLAHTIAPLCLCPCTHPPSPSLPLYPPVVHALVHGLATPFIYALAPSFPSRSSPHLCPVCSLVCTLVWLSWPMLIRPGLGLCWLAHTYLCSSSFVVDHPCWHCIIVC